MANSWRFQAEEGFFADLSQVAGQYPYGKVTTQPGLALISRSYPTDGESRGGDKSDWERFAAYVRARNRDAPDGVSFKVLYLTRHGFGYHNQKHMEVGTEAWDNHWSLINGDETTTWFDSFLTETGIQQAKDLEKFWNDLVDKDGAPIPETLYASPLARCLQTTKHVFSSLMESHNQPFRPIVKEKLRERFTMHTCDLRRSRSWIEQNYPGYPIEEGFEEEDPFQGFERMETDEEHIARKQAVLEDIFSSDEGEFLSLTVHSYAINAIQGACHAKAFKVREGSSMAMLVRGERLKAPSAVS